MTILVRQNTYGAWLDGDVTAYEALRALCSDYEELDATYRDFEKMRDQTRAQISEVVSRMDGEKAEVKGFGTVRLTQASTVARWKGDELDRLATELAAVGLQGVADRILACKEMTMRAGSLRIEREKQV